MELIPWDHDSDEQSQRLYLQRVACGWAWDIEKFKENSEKGSNVIYWVVLKDDFPGREDLMAKHFAKFPEESSPLTDTATTIWAEPREPPPEPGRAFAPLGHVGLGVLRPDDERATAAAAAAAARDETARPTTAWVGPLYVSWAVQRSGLGRFAMDEVERLAALPPASADLIALDAIAPEQALAPDLLKTSYESRGFPSPVKANYTWYLERGYTPYLRKDDMYPWTDCDTGEEKKLSTIYMSKRLSRALMW